MNNQIDIIKNATKFYLIQLNEPKDGMSKVRFQIYAHTGDANDLQVLWPSDSDKGAKFQDKLSYQVYSSTKNYPAFHFALSGCGYSKKGELKEMLANVRGEKTEDITLLSLNGYSPSYS